MGIVVLVLSIGVFLFLFYDRKDFAAFFKGNRKNASDQKALDIVDSFWGGQEDAAQFGGDATQWTQSRYLNRAKAERSWSEAYLEAMSKGIDPYKKSEIADDDYYE